MNTRAFGDLLAAASRGKLSRRSVLRRAVALGLSAPAISAILAACGSSSSTSSSGSSSQATSSATSGTGSTTGGTPATGNGTASASSTATTETASSGKAGGAGELRLLWWQAPTILVAAQSSGTKDYDAARITQEPLADFDKDNKMVAVLAAEVPSKENGGLSADGLTVTWKCRQGVKWHDGQPFTANDVKFTFDYYSNPDVAASTYGNYKDVKSVDVVDDYTVKVTFKAPQPAWFLPFCGANGHILPEHVLKDFNNDKAKSAPFNLKPIGTGPFKVVNFKPGDVGTWTRNDDYWQPGKPHFDSITMKGGGDVTSAARAVIQTGEEDWAWNLQIEPAVLNAMQKGGSQGKIFTWPGGGTERFSFNFSDPNKETDGQKSYYKNPHPHFSVKEVRQAVNMLLDRKTIAEQLYGPGGTATVFTTNNSPDYNPTDISWEFNIDKANQLLDQAGAKKGGDGTRELGGRKMEWVYSTSVNQVRQKTQEIVKDACSKAGIKITLKSVDASIFFSGDPGNVDELNHFYCDIEMFTNGDTIYPSDWYQRYLSADPDRDICQKSNQWVGGTNFQRYQSAEFNDLYAKVVEELDTDKQKELF
ncbi:MAG TPA: peptide ABC transporter substrate-binding protein, partial [Thermomicrobiaceae bacterium]|nr:peptide ABC transporter substrate-binding protein [Thermomicrobiaceae bacterium]